MFVSISQILLKAGAYLAGKSRFYQRLCGSLVVDSSFSARLLDWSPPISFDEGLYRAAKDFLS